jgi:hypothetical protein
MRPITCAAAAAALIAFLVACHGSATSPTGGSSTTAAVTALSITGPDRIAPGESVSFTATATLSDRTTQDYTRKVAWSSYPSGVLTMSRDTGQATGQTPGDAFVTANLVSSVGVCCHATVTALVLSPNTYRLTGKVLESGLSLYGAAVTVVSGVGSGLSTTTDYDGQYRLYGVSGTVQVRVSKPGYTDIVKSIDVFQNDVLDFPEARQTAVLPSMGGAYTLTLQADPGCPTVAPDPRTLVLPLELRQPRNYAAQVVQDGASLVVTLPGHEFVAPSNRFSGRIMPDGIEFQFGDGYIGYGPDDAITEHISSTQALSFEGAVHAVRSGSTLIGRLDGDVQAFEIHAFYMVIGHCQSANHLFTMTVSTAGFSR